MSPATGHSQGIPVFDASSFGQLIAQLQQGAQQLSAVQQQLQAQLSMLQSLPTSILAPVGQLSQATQQLMSQVSNIQSMGSSLTSELNSVYPSNFSTSNPQEILNQISAMTAANRQASITAMQLQNQVEANAPQLQSAIGNAVTASNAAPGPTAVGQATNQILAAQSQQLGDLQSLLVVEQRQQDDEQLQRQAGDAALQQMNNAPDMPLNSGEKF